MSRIVILNGPIGCGKDTVGQAFADREGYYFTCFKEPMFRIAATTMGLDYESFLDSYQDREWKESPNALLNGHTVRELMIHISEVYVKPFLGPDYFGQQALNFINQRPWQQNFIFGDGGFPMEIDVLAEAGHEVILVHMYRDGCTFEGDSRSYVLTNAIPHIHTLNNNGTVEQAVDELGRILDYHDDQREPAAETEQDETSAPVQRISRRHSAPRRGNGRAVPRGIEGFSERIRQIQERMQPQTESQGFVFDTSGGATFNGGRFSVSAVRYGDVTEASRSLEETLARSAAESEETYALVGEPDFVSGNIQG
jgi:hypothetical protein